MLPTMWPCAKIMLLWPNTKRTIKNISTTANLTQVKYVSYGISKYYIITWQYPKFEYCHNK